VNSVFFILLLILQVNTNGLKKVNEILKIISKMGGEGFFRHISVTVTLF